MRQRQPQYPIDYDILQRWSPRAMSGASMDHDTLMSLFEAARWAPSSFNNQPWRFIYAHRETAAWDTLFSLLVDFNQQWAQHAAVLVVMISCDTFSKTGKPSRTSSFDTGAAWENLALQATKMNIVAHAMEGFSYKKARTQLAIPEGYTIEAMLALGYPADASILPSQLQEREELSGRKPVTEFVCHGNWQLAE